MRLVRETGLLEVVSLIPDPCPAPDAVTSTSQSVSVPPAVQERSAEVAEVGVPESAVGGRHPGLEAIIFLQL